MSKINAIRLINVNYNHDAIHVSDETLHLNGQSTLISLQNGGGKSVLVQLLTAPLFGFQKKYCRIFSLHIPIPLSTLLKLKALWLGQQDYESAEEILEK